MICSSVGKLSLYLKDYRFFLFLVYDKRFRGFLRFDDIMSVSEREQALLVHRERRMTIMIAVYAASSTKGADHDILKFEFI